MTIHYTRDTVEIDVSHLETRHIRELEDHAEKLRWQMTHDARPVPAHGWTCFHCAQTFTTWPSAAAHFGDDPLGGRPVCCSADRQRIERLEAAIQKALGFGFAHKLRMGARDDEIAREWADLKRELRAALRRE